MLCLRTGRWSKCSLKDVVLTSAAAALTELLQHASFAPDPFNREYVCLPMACLWEGKLLIDPKQKQSAPLHVNSRRSSSIEC